MKAHESVTPPQSLGKRVTSGIGWLAVAQVARRLSGLVVTAVLARLLAPQDFGLIALASLAAQLLGIVTELGLTSALVQRKTVSDADLSTGFWFGLTISFTVALAGYLSADLIAALFNEPRIVPLFRAMLVILPVAAIGQVPDAILQRKLDFQKIAHVDWLSGVGSGVLGIAAAFAGYGVWALVVQLVSATVIALVVRQVAVRWTPRFTFSMASARTMVTFGASLVAMGLVNYAAVNIDNALIGARIGAAALGYYMLAYNLILLPSNNIGGLVTRVMFPALSSIQSDRARFVRAYSAMLRTVAFATFPLVVGLGVTAPLAIATIYGPQWEASVILLEILMAIGLFQAINVSGVAFSAIGKPHILLAWALVSLAVMTAGFVVGSRWGVTGVAWSYLIVSPLVNLPPHLIANRLIGLRQADFFRIVGAPLVASLAMGVVVLGVQRFVSLSALPLAARLITVSLFGGLVYAAVVYAMASMAGRGSTPLAWITRPEPSLGQA